MSSRSYDCSDQNRSRGGKSSCHGGCWCSLVGSELWVSEVSSDELSSGFSENLVVWLDNGLDDMDVISSGTMSTGHFTVHHWDGTAEGVVSVFLVHVYDTSGSKIFEHNTVVLDGVGFSLEDLGGTDDFTLALSDFVLSLHFIPELGSSKDHVLCEDSDSEACWLFVSLTW